MRLFKPVGENHAMHREIPRSLHRKRMNTVYSVSDKPSAYILIHSGDDLAVEDFSLERKLETLYVRELFQKNSNGSRIYHKKAYCQYIMCITGVIIRRFFQRSI